MLARKIARSVHEAARDKARAIAKTEAYAISCRERKKVEMLFAHLKRILRLSRLRLRGPSVEPRTSSYLSATAQNLRELAKLILFPEPALRPVRRRAGTSASLTPPQIPSAGSQNRGSSTKSTLTGHWRSLRGASHAAVVARRAATSPRHALPTTQKLRGDGHPTSAATSETAAWAPIST